MIDINKLKKRFDDLFNDPTMSKDFEDFIVKKRNIIENTLENKAKFFALYLNRKKCIIRRGYINRDNIEPNGVDEYDSLELKPLSYLLISDEDAIEVAKITTIQDTTGDDVIPFVKSCIKAYINKKCKGMDSNIADYLRSKGYALPYMGTSVETMIKWGWIKLKED